VLAFAFSFPLHFLVVHQVVASFISIRSESRISVEAVDDVHVVHAVFISACFDSR
jgi:hypothetical protein